MSRLLAVIITLLIAAPLSAQQKVFDQLQYAAEASRSANPGAPFEGSIKAAFSAVRGPAAMAASPSLGLDKSSRSLETAPADGAGLASQSTFNGGEEHNFFAPPYQCRGLFTCLGRGLVSPLLDPVAMTVVWANLGHDYAECTDGGNAILGGVVGGAAGLLLGIVAAPFDFGNGIAFAFEELFQGNP